MRKLIYSALILFLNYQGFSQNPSSLVSSISKEIKETQTESKSFQQILELQNNNGKAKAKVVEIDKKGKSTVNEYSFNFRDISKEALRYKIEKDLIKITISTIAKSNFIEIRENGEFKKFNNEFDFYVRDYEKAKEIIENFSKIQIFFSEIKPENSPPDDFNLLRDWIIKNIAGVSSEKVNIDQSISFNPEIPVLARFTTKESTSNGQKVVFYNFNLSDLNCENLNINVKGNLFSLEIPTKGKAKFISVNENGKPQNNSAYIELFSKELDKIKLWKDAFKSISTHAELLYSKSAPNIDNPENALDYFNIAFSGQISKNCDCSLELKDEDKIKKYEFNFFDLDEYSPIFKVSGKNYSINLKTKGGQNYITSFEGDQLEKFTSSFALLHNDLEKFRYMDKAVKTIIKNCQDTYKLNVPSGEVLARLNWLKVKIPNFKNETTSINQKLEFTNEEPCKLKYKTTVNVSGKGKITEYEIKPYLLDVYSSMVKISGKNAFVTFNTIAKEKVIAITEDGKPGNFTNTFSIQIDDIQRAKEVYEVFRTVINDCK